MKLSKFKTDLNAAKNGVKVQLDDDSSVTIARAGEANPEYSKTLRELMKPYQTQARAGSLPDAVFEDIINKCYAECILLGWEGLEDDQGNTIPYSKDKAFEILSDKAYVEFRKLVMELSSEAATFAVDVTDETKSSS